MTTSALDPFKLWALSPRVVFLKAETTGVRSEHEVVELALVTLDETVIFHERVRPLRGVPREVERFHGLTDQVLAPCPDWAAVWPRLKPILLAHRVVAYNADFYTRLLRQSVVHLGPTGEEDAWLGEVRPQNGTDAFFEPVYAWECAMDAYARVAGQYSDTRERFISQRFDVALRREGVSPVTAARLPSAALRGAVNLARLVRACAERWDG